VASNWSVHIDPVAKNLPRKMVVRCVAIANAGKSNVPLPGWDTSGDWRFATNARCTSIMLFSMSPVSSSPSDTC